MNALEFGWLDIEDFKSFRGKHEFDLGAVPGVYYVTGRNRVAPELGSNGIGKSTLWDALLWVIAGRTVRDVRPGAAVEPWQGGKPLVRLEWRRNGVKYVLERSRKPIGLFLTVDKGKAQAVDQKAVDEALGLSAETFCRTVLAGQFGTLFLDLKPEQQATMFADILALDGWLLASQEAAAAAGEADAKVRDADRRVAAVRATLEELQAQITRAVESRDRFEDDIGETLDTAKAQVTKLRGQLKALKPPAAVEDLDDLRRVLTAAAADKDKATRAYNASNRREAELAAELRNLNDQREAALDFVSSYSMQLKKKAPKCPDCGQTVSQDHIEAKYAAADKLAAALADQIQQVSADRDAAREEMVEQQDLLKAAERKAAKARDEIDAKTAARGTYDREKAKLEQSLKRAEDDVAYCKTAENPHDQTVSELKERRADKRAALGDVEAELASARATYDGAKYWAKTFKEIRLDLIDQTLQELEFCVNRHAERLGLVDWQMRFATERENASGKLSQGFTVLIFPPDKDEPIAWESYSGGESQRWQLAVLFGLSEVLLTRAGLSPNIEILDEPTKHLSQQGVDDLIERLQDRALETKRAIYFVDHMNHDRQGFSGVVEIEKTAKGSAIVRSAV